MFSITDIIIIIIIIIIMARNVSY